MTSWATNKNWARLRKVIWTTHQKTLSSVNYMMCTGLLTTLYQLLRLQNKEWWDQCEYKKKSTMTPSTWDGIGIPATPEYNVQLHAAKLNGPYFEEQLMLKKCLIVAQDSSVGIATHYGLDSPGIESQWGVRLSAPVQPDRPWSPPTLLYNGYGVFHGGKVARVWHWPPIPIYCQG